MYMKYPDIRSRPIGFMIVFPEDNSVLVYERCLEGAVAIGRDLCRLGHREWTWDDGSIFYAGILDGHNYEQEIKNGWTAQHALEKQKKELTPEELEYLGEISDEDEKEGS
jgi:hypothetical protein